MKHVTDKAWEFKGVHEKMHIHTQHIHVKDCAFLSALTWTKLNSLQLRVPPTEGKDVNPSRTKRKKPRIPSAYNESVRHALVLSK